MSQMKTRNKKGLVRENFRQQSKDKNVELKLKYRGGTELMLITP